MQKVRTVTYLCDCGARNQIAAPPQEHRETALYYCQTCGKPSHDLCQQCGYRSPVGSDHAYCQQCGAGSEDIRRGVAVVDIARRRGELVQFAAITACVIYPMQTWLIPFLNQRALRMAQGTETHDPIPLVLLGLLLVYIAPALVVPLYTLLTGRKRAPLGVRALAQMWRFGDLDGAEEGFTILARRAHILLHRRVRRLRRRFRLVTATMP